MQEATSYDLSGRNATKTQRHNVFMLHVRVFAPSRLCGK